MALRTQRQDINSATVAYTIAEWDDETGNGELVEYDRDGRKRRRCVLAYLPDNGTAAPGDVIGEAAWYDASGVELERKPILEP